MRVVRTAPRPPSRRLQKYFREMYPGPGATEPAATAGRSAERDDFGDKNVAGMPSVFREVLRSDGIVFSYRPYTIVIRK